MASSTKSNMRSKPMLDRHGGVKSIMVLIATFSSERHGYEHGCRCAAPAKPGEWRLAEIQLGIRLSCVKILLTEKKTLGISAVRSRHLPRSDSQMRADAAMRACC